MSSPLVKRIFFAAFSVFAMWVLLELSFGVLKRVKPALFRLTRIEAQQDKIGDMPFDPQLLWRLQPGQRNTFFGTLTIDELGMRTLPPTDSKNGNILFLGDSSTFGFGVSDQQSYTHLAAKCLAMQGFNAGVPGYTSTQSRFQLEKLAPVVDADIVVVASLWSDIMQSRWSDRELYQKFGPKSQSPQFKASTVLQRSHVYTFLQALILNRRELSEDRKIFWKNIINGDPTIAPEDEKPRVSLASYEENLIAINQRIQQMGAQSLHLLLPTNTDHPQPEEGGQYRAISTQVALQYGGKVVDMDAVYQKLEAKQRSTRFMDVVHPSVAGHADIAKSICKRLSTSK